ncbi:NaeI family type II restriction endonuclease [Streptomyces iconiensis]|uniref:NaeI family type II restriction endonuclease n=1 Tax=Streptomyces iconiensis TaxID=1384038 RepID=UPI003D2F8719
MPRRPAAHRRALLQSRVPANERWPAGGQPGRPHDRVDGGPAGGRTKRARDARLPQRLGGGGIVVLGHGREHRAMAEALGIPAPRRGSWVVAQLAAPSDDDPRRSIAISEQDYVLSEETEPAASVLAPY